MANTRPKKIKPLRAFEVAQAIVVLIDAGFVIRYANAACCKWIEIPEENLIGLKCVYSSAELDSPLKNRVAGLCPPPEVFDGTPAIGSVFRRDARGNRFWRSAVFTMLKYADLDLALVVASGEEKNTPPVPAGNELPFAESMHDALAALRNRTLQTHSLDYLVGTSPYAVGMRRQVAAAMESHADVLIVGPPGSGRQHLARTIFTHRKPPGGNLIPINCAIADGELIQQSFKQCLTQQKSSGSNDCVLLQNVDQLSEVGQNELLGFSSLPGFRLGTFATAGTDLRELAKLDGFSPGLAHYLSAQIIEMVALKDRREDIPYLMQALVEVENASRSQQISGFESAVVELCEEYHWPGNMKQLRQCIQQAAAAAKSSMIQLRDLPHSLQLGIDAARVGSATETRINMDRYLEEIETELIARALRQAKNNKTKTAWLLGINRARLARRLDHLGFTTKQDVASDPEMVDPSAFEEADE